MPDADAVFAEAELIVKVKEPQPDEVARLEPRHTLFTYLHLAPDPELTRGLIDSGATCIAYETVEDARGRLPLLAPMSEVAGKIATQAGRVHAREAARRPRHPARRRARRRGRRRSWSSAAAWSAMNAAVIAIGMGAEVYVFDRNIDRLRELDVLFDGRARRASPRRSRSSSACPTWTS